MDSVRRWPGVRRRENVRPPPWMLTPETDVE